MARQGAYGSPEDPEARTGWRGPLTFPRIQGGDIAGTIVDVGADVGSHRLGQRVLVDPTLYQDESAHAAPIGLVGSERDGGFAEYVAVGHAQAHDVSDSPLSDEQLACLPIAYGTAMGMLERGDVREQETVLVTGASGGGVGLALVQLGAIRGATVVAVTGSDKAEQVYAAGADLILTRDSGGLDHQLATAAPHGVQVVADVAGGALLEQLLPSLTEDGRWIIAGAVAGAVISFDLRRLYLHNRRLVGSSMHTREHFAQLVRIARSGNLAPRIAHRYALADIHRAQQQFLAGTHVGKIVLTPG